VAGAKTRLFPWLFAARSKTANERRNGSVLPTIDKRQESDEMGHPAFEF